MFRYLIAILVSILITQSLGQEIHCSKFHYEEQMLEKMIRMEIRMEELQKHVGQLERRIDTVTEVMPTQQHTSTTAFFATAKSHRVYSSGQTLVFEDLVTNIGEAYYPASGLFIAPTSGTYVFFSTILGSNDIELWNCITVNDKVVAKFNSRGTGGRHDSGTASVVLQLSTGDSVSVKNLGSNGKTHGDSYTHFGGFQIGL